MFSGHIDAFEFDAEIIHVLVPGSLEALLHVLLKQHFVHLLGYSAAENGELHRNQAFSQDSVLTDDFRSTGSNLSG